MTLTREQRAEISRQNGKKSRGPKTDEGKAISRRNATRHGLRAAVITLPDEDPTIIQARSDAWNDYYQPISPGAQHLVNACVSATLLSDRVDRAQTTAMAQLIRDAPRNWDRAREDELQALTDRFRAEPAETVLQLGRLGNGCRYLLSCWEELDRLLDTLGHWSTGECQAAAVLLGQNPDAPAAALETIQYQITLYSLICRADHTEEEVLALLEPARVPADLQASHRPDNVPPREACLRWLRGLVDDQMLMIQSEEERLRTGHDEPDRAGAPALAMLTGDAPSARLLLRYHAEARLAFKSAYSELLKTLERDKAEACEPEPESVAASEECTYVKRSGPSAGRERSPRRSPNEPSRRRPEVVIGTSAAYIDVSATPNSGRRRPAR